MKRRIVVPLVVLAISCTFPTFAQQTNTLVPQLREQLLALAKKFDEAQNNNDAAAVAALYTQDAVMVADPGPDYGREAIEKYWGHRFQRVHFSNHLGTVDHYSRDVIGTASNQMWWKGEWSQTVKGQNFDPAEQSSS